MPRQMKDSGIEWIGEIPVNWEIHPAKYAFSEIKYKNTDGLVTNALKFKSGSIIRKENFDSSDDDYVADTILNYTIVEPNTIMINGLNLNYDLKSYRVGIVREKGIITSAYLALCPDSDKILPDYANYLFKGYETKMAFHNMGAGIRLTLGFREFKTQPVLFPELDEQKRIVDFLNSQCDCIDSVIEKTKASIEEYKKLKQAIITEAVTKGVRGERPSKDSGIKWICEIPEEWKISRLKSIFDFGKGLPITKDNLEESGIPVISYGQIHAKYNTGVSLDERLFRYVNDSYLLTNPDSLVKVGDIIVADTSEDLEGCGNSAYVDETVKLFAGYHTIILKSKISRPLKFFAYMMKSDCWRSQLRCNAAGVKLFSVSKKMLGNTTYVMPSWEEQSEIVEYLDGKCSEIDSIIEKKIIIIDEIERLKKSLIYEYVTGKKEVPAS